MAHESDKPDLDRRKLLKYMGATGAVGLAGCSTETGDGTSQPGTSGTTEGTDTGTPTAVETSTKEYGNTLVGPDGEPVKLKFVYRTGTETGKTTAQFMKQELSKIGIDVEFESAPFNTLLSKYAANTYEGNTTYNAGPRDEATSKEAWDLMWGIGFNTYPMTPTSIAPFFIDERKGASASINYYGYRPTGGYNFEKKLNEISTMTDDAARQEALADVFGFISKDQPFGMVQFGDDISGFQNNVQGLNVGFSLGYDSHKWYFAPDENSDPSVKGSYISGTGTDAKTLNFIQISDTSSNLRVSLTMDGAYTINNDFEIEPRWVKSIESENKKDWTVTLRENLQWSDEYGQMTAEDWVWFIQNVRQSEENWAGDTNHTDWFRGDGPIPVEKTGKYSFEIHLPEVDPDFARKPVMWGMYTMPKDLVKPYADAKDGEGLDKDEEVQTLSYTGNLGPYNFERWDRESRFVATRNPDYYMKDVEGNNAPYFNERVYQVFGEESTRLAALKSGEITSTAIPPAKAKSFEQNDDINVVQTPSPYISVLTYNMRANGWNPFRKREVRQAFAYAINKQAIAENINRGYSRPAHTYQPKYSKWYDASKVMRTGVGGSHSYQKSKELLASALEGDGYKYEDR